ncbi:MAG TPA: hypothetical protein VH680_01330 [Gemmatimonadales bacterium]|jgi:hypothetical protein
MRASLWPTVAIAVASACGGGDREPGTGEWEFQDDSVASLRVVGQEGPEGEPRKRSVILSFDCLADNTGGRIMTEQALRQGTVEARLTVDQEPPLALPGFAGTTPSGGQVVLTIPQESLLTVLGGHQRAVIAYEDGAGSSKTVAEFPIAGVETYRERFLAACAGRR